MRILKISKLNIFLVSIMMMAILLCCSGQVQAAQDGDYTYTVTDGKAQITGYTGAGGVVTIPNTLGGFPVISIGDYAFNCCIGLTNISIPQGVTSIGSHAFSSCTSLTSITFNSATTTIYDSAYTIPTATKIIGYNPSTAKNYATKYHRSFEVIDPYCKLQFISTTYFITEAGPTATITVNRVGGNTGAVGVNYATHNGTAIAGSDYTNTTGTLSFPAGVTTNTFTIPIINDTISESNETVKLTLYAPTGGATLGTQSNAVLIIEDNDKLYGKLQFSSAAYSVSETGATASITVSRVNGSTGAVGVTYATSNGTATAGSDYTAKTGTLSFADGQVTQTFTVPITNDTISESNEYVNLTLYSPTGGATLGTPSQAILTIVDNDTLYGKLQFSSAAYSVSETGTTASITVSRVNGCSGAVGVTYATSNGTATAGSDYTTKTGTLSFAAGQITKTFTVPIINDTSVESNETVILQLSNPTGGATLGTPIQATLTIVDNDKPYGKLQFSSAAYSISEAGTTATITVSRVNGSSGAVGVTYATSNGTAKAGSDYTTKTGTLTFADGELTKTFTISIKNDTAVENNETVILKLSNPTGGATLGTPSQATLTIVDDDATHGKLQFGAVTYSVSEAGPTAIITVSRVNGSTGTVRVSYATSNGTAKAGSDYTTKTGTLTFADGELTKTFTISIKNDTAVENNETVILKLGNPTGGATLGTPIQAVLTIVDNDSTTDSYIPDPVVNFLDVFTKYGIIGDSLSSGEVSYKDTSLDGVGYIDIYDKSWGHYLAQKASANVNYFCMGGMSARQWFRHVIRDKKTGEQLLTDADPCDVYFIALGENDCRGYRVHTWEDNEDDYVYSAAHLGTTADIGTETDSFYGNYSKVIATIHAKSPKAHIFCLTLPKEKSNILEIFNGYQDAIRYMAENSGNLVHLIDLQEANNLYGWWDTGGVMDVNKRNSHYNAVGYKTWANIIELLCTQYMRENYSKFLDVEFILMDNYEMPD